MRRAYKYRLYPNANQTRELEINLKTLRRLYNHALELRRNAWEGNQQSISFKELSQWFTAERQANPWYARLNRNTAQSCLKRLDKAYQNFFRRVQQGAAKPGFPRFKSPERFDSIEYLSPNNGYKLKGDRIYLQTIGDVKVKFHRPMAGKLKQVVVKREGDHWYVVLSCDLGEIKAPAVNRPPIGLAIGVESFLTTSDGETIANRVPLERALPCLRVLSRAVSRKQKGGSNRRKAVRRLRKLHQRIANLRKENHHQTSIRLVRRYGLIAAESPTIPPIVRSRRLARAILDTGWGSFLGMVRYKAAEAGVAFVEVEARGVCPQCGRLVREPATASEATCADCGCLLHTTQDVARLVLDRALNGPDRAGGAQTV